MYMQSILYGNVFIEEMADGTWELLDPSTVTIEYVDQMEKKDPKSYIVGPKRRRVPPEYMYHYEVPDKVAYIHKIKQFIDINEALVYFTKAFYANGGFIGDIITTNATNKEQLLQIKRDYEASHSGVDSANKTLFLPRETGAILRQSGGGNKQVTEEKRSNRDDILAAMGTPKHVLGVTETGASRADSEAKQFAYFLNTIGPAAQSIYDFFTTRVLPRYGGEGLFIEIVSQIEGDRNQNREDAVAILGSKNTKAFGTINEARALMKLPAIEGGDIIPSSNVITPNDPDDPEGGEITDTPINTGASYQAMKVRYKDMTFTVPDICEKEFDVVTRKIVTLYSKINYEKKN